MDLWPMQCIASDDCSQVLDSFRDLVLHVRRSHTLAQRVFFKCPLPHCAHQFSSGDSFRKHAEYLHKNEYGARVRPTNPPCGAARTDVCSGGEEPDLQDESMDCAVVSTPASASDVFCSMMKMLPAKASTMRLLIEHKFNIPTSVAQGIHDESLLFALSLCQQFGEVALLRLKELGVSDERLEFYLECPDLEATCKAIGQGGLSTLHSLGYIEPQEIDLLSLAEKEGQVHPPPQPARKRPVMHYVPILATLKSYLGHADVLQQVLREHSQNKMSTYTSGLLFKEHPLFMRSPNALRLTLYTDELEVCNPLGGNNVKHKICCVYFQVGNVGPKHLSSLTSIHLAILVKDSYRKQFGYEVILRPLLDDIRILSSSGITVTVDGDSYCFRGCVVAVCGDNLSAHQLGGYRRTFSSGKICRWCLADYGEISQLHCEQQCYLRTSYTMRRHAELVRGDKDLEAVYGITGSSVLTELRYFQLPDCLPPDIMHDIYEKCLTLNVKITLKGLHRNKVLNYQKALKLIANFEFQIVDRKNRAPPLHPLLMRASSRKQIRGSASQKWHLFHFLSLILGPHVPQGNVFWELHLLLNRICDIVFATTVTPDMIENLKRLITSYMKLWVSKVKGAFPPKMHYLLHYPRMMLLFGSLRFQWCMRFEAFHLFLKRISQKCNNFINITKTLATRVQRKRCIEYSGLSALPNPVNVTSRQKTCRVGSLPLLAQEALGEMYGLDKSSILVEVQSATFSGLQIRKNCFNILEVIDGTPVFFLTAHIYIASGELCVFGERINPLRFNSHLHAYEIVVESSLTSLLHASKFQPCQTLHAYNICGKTYIKVKFACA